LLHYLYWESGLQRKDFVDRVIGEGRQDEAERESRAELAAGKGVTFDSGKAAIQWLQEEPRPPARIDARGTYQIGDTDEKAPETTYTDGPLVVVDGRDDPTEPVFHSRVGIPDVSLEEGCLVLRDGLPFDRYQEIVSNLEATQRNLNWFIGDAVLYGERTYGEEAYQAFSGFESMGFGIERIKQAGWVASQFPPNTRVKALSWSAHRTVAALPEPERTELLERAADEGMTTRELREAASPKAACSHTWLTVRRCSQCHQWEDA
jgi:hypothetical protein